MKQNTGSWMAINVVEMKILLKNKNNHIIVFMAQYISSSVDSLSPLPHSITT